MPTWTTPPTFSDGAVLSAAQLNILSNDLAYLQGVAAAPNVPAMMAGKDLTSKPTYYLIRHRHNFLHLWYDAGVMLSPSGPDLDEVTIAYGGNTVYTDGSPDPGINTVTYDISGEGLTVGDLYIVELNWQMKEGGSTFKIYWYEAES